MKSGHKGINSRIYPAERINMWRKNRFMLSPNFLGIKYMVENCCITPVRTNNIYNGMDGAPKNDPTNSPITEDTRRILLSIVLIRTAVIITGSRGILVEML